MLCPRYEDASCRAQLARGGSRSQADIRIGLHRFSLGRRRPRVGPVATFCRSAPPCRRHSWAPRLSSPKEPSSEPARAPREPEVDADRALPFKFVVAAPIRGCFFRPSLDEVSAKRPTTASERKRREKAEHQSQSALVLSGSSGKAPRLRQANRDLVRLQELWSCAVAPCVRQISELGPDRA